jgi:hypothetical protein
MYEGERGGPVDRALALAPAPSLWVLALSARLLHPWRSMASNDSAPRRRSRGSLLALSVLLAACGGSSFQSAADVAGDAATADVAGDAATADIAGDYSVTLTNGSNGCQFTNWTSGSTVQDVHVTVEQQGTMATATVDGLAAAFFDVVLGTAAFQGSVQGDSFTLTAIGSNAAKVENCSFTIRATMAGAISGATIQGTVTYTETTNGSPDCGYRSTCSSVESFAGVRAPAADGG